MRKDQAIDRIVEFASDMKLRLERLLSLYGDLEPIVEQEHEAIGQGDMAAVAHSQQTKGGVTDAVHKEYEHLQEICRSIAAMRQEACPDLEPPKAVTLKGTLSLMLDIGDELFPGALGHEVVVHQIRGIEEVLEDFDDKVKQVQPLLEKNMTIVTKMLANIQQSYQFHVSLVEQEAAAYSEQGVKKNDGTHSGFKVGA